MKTYTVEITETLQKQIKVKANSESEAIDIVQEQYDNEDIVLYSEDFVDVNIDIVD